MLFYGIFHFQPSLFDFSRGRFLRFLHEVVQQYKLIVFSVKTKYTVGKRPKLPYTSVDMLCYWLSYTHPVLF
jgi:hypothetical protein